MKSNQKHILIAVTTDVVSDMRVQKVCHFLNSKACKIVVIGRKLPSTFPKKLPYKVKLMNLPFSKGIPFYISFNISFFFRGLFQKADLIVANDLDTLLPSYLLSRIKRCDLVYDSHEYFTESAGLNGKKYKKKVWETIEKWIFPKLKHVITVNESIAEIYKQKYNQKIHVVRNIPLQIFPVKLKSKVELGLKSSSKIVLLQGGYIDNDRGGLELIKAMQFKNSDILLLIIGSGQEVPIMKSLTKSLNLSNKILFIPKIPSEQLIQYTLNADLGISIDKATNLNYKYSLPNKVFDYMRSEVPMLISNLPELIKIHQKHPFGLILDSHDPIHIASKIEEALNSPNYSIWKENLSIASKEYTWENELKVIESVFNKLIQY
jgi:glycosyltransferase involved in cell wall biosynthesis